MLASWFGDFAYALDTVAFGSEQPHARHDLFADTEPDITLVESARGASRWQKLS